MFYKRTQEVRAPGVRCASFIIAFLLTTVLALSSSCKGALGGEDKNNNDGLVLGLFALASSSQISLSTRALTGGVPAANGQIAITDNTNTLILTRVRIVLDEVELEKENNGVDCDDPTAPADACYEFEAGPFLLDLDLSGGVAQEVSVNVPAGVYDEVEVKIRPVDSSSHEDADFLAANPDMGGRSILIEGTYNGTPFTFSSAILGEVEMALNPALDITTAQNYNITMNIDINTWFLNPTNNAVLDPSVTANVAVIESNIAASFTAASTFHASEDNDHDGEDDHGPNHN